MDKAQKCPECGEGTDRDSVDVGVGMMYGPEYCPYCGWSSDPDAGKVIDGRYHAADGSTYSVDRIVERAERFGLGKAAKKAFGD